MLSSSFELRHVASSEGGDVRKAIGGTTSWILRASFLVWQMQSDMFLSLG